MTEKWVNFFPRSLIRYVASSTDRNIHRAPLILTGIFDRKIIASVFTVVLLLGVNSIFGSEESKKLKLLQEKIASLQKTLSEENKEKNQAVTELQKVETAMNKTSARLYSIDKKLKKTQKKLDTLEIQQRNLMSSFSNQQRFLVQQIRASYSMGNQEYFKLLLNQEDPSRLARMVVYYQYLNNMRVDKMNTIQQDLDRSRQIENQIIQTSAELKKIREQVASERSALAETRSKRKQWVAKLSKQLKEKNKALEVLLRDEQHLKKLLKQIENELKDVQLDLKPPKPFAALKGQLPWPTMGSLGARFGSSRNAGNLKWNGVVINTDAEQPIKSVAYGQVIFADWLRGFGMLIIIDHGGGYMSLYGHNESLLKKPGDWVQAEDIIALSGKSGGQKSSSLYFEIRHNGKPQNPSKWCQRLRARNSN